MTIIVNLFIKLIHDVHKLKQFMNSDNSLKIFTLNNYKNSL